jgi:DNA-binding GntR family transcriptional regulator
VQVHQLIARASGNRWLADLIKRLMDDMRRMLAFDPRYVTPQQHLEIIEALKHRDRAKAEQAMKRHMEETKPRLLERFWPKAICSWSMANTSDRRAYVNQ